MGGDEHDDDDGGRCQESFLSCSGTNSHNHSFEEQTTKQQKPNKHTIIVTIPHPQAKKAGKQAKRETPSSHLSPVLVGIRDQARSLRET